MKKDDPSPQSELHPQYRREDLGKGVRGKYFAAYQKGTNLVLLRPEVAAAFPTSEAVNEALLALMKAGQESAPSPRHRRPRAAKAAPQS